MKEKIFVFFNKASSIIVVFLLMYYLEEVRDPLKDEIEILREEIICCR